MYVITVLLQFSGNYNPYLQRKEIDQITFNIDWRLQASLEKRLQRDVLIGTDLLTLTV